MHILSHVGQSPGFTTIAVLTWPESGQHSHFSVVNVSAQALPYRQRIGLVSLFFTPGIGSWLDGQAISWLSTSANRFEHVSPFSTSIGFSFTGLGSPK